MKISLIIVSWNVSNLLKECLDSIIKYTKNIEYEIIVVDNASVDATDEMIKKYSNIRYIKNNSNLGFGKACNQGLNVAKGEYVVFLNPDIKLKHNLFYKLANKMDEDKTIGFIGPKILNSDGTFQKACRRSIPNPKTAFFKLIGFSKLFPKHKKFSKYNLGDLSIDSEMEVEAISGSCLFARKDILDKINGFDEDFFMYGEDLDLCYRISKQGYKGYYLPLAEVIHHHRASSNKRIFKSKFNFYYSAYLFYKKHFRSFWLEIFVISGLFFKLLFDYVKNILEKIIYKKM
jgi:O-antigen biosynthesis protein